MSATSVGQIGLDLVVNQKQFNKQMKSLDSVALKMGKKLGKALVAGFSVKKIAEFSQQCIELGSDLQEVENVVSVTFPSMSAKIDKFAKDAAGSFGLSETMAKKYSSTLGSMAKAFGFTEAEAYDMGTTLAGLAGDVASFYNLSQDEAYTKLKSVFTGETESLKDLGVVMTQSALDSYALANGFGKTTNAMSEAEKVALRYAFVQDKLSAAQGDFARTSDSWANQTKVLSLQFESLKATIGQGLISAFTPVLKVINTLLQKIQVLAVAFKDMMEGIFGKQSAETSALSTAAENAASAAASTANSTGATADNLKKSNKFLAGFDVINKSSGSTDTGSSNTMGINSTGTTNMNLDQSVGGGTSGAINKLDGFLIYLDKTFSPTFERVWKKFSIPLGDFKRIFSNVLADVRTLAQTFINYLQGPFTQFLVTVFEDAGTIGAGYLDSFNKVFSGIWDEVALPLLEKLINEWLPGYTKFGTQFSTCTTQVFSEIKRVFDTVWSEAAQPFLGKITEMFISLMDILGEFWNNWGEPIFSSLKEAVQKTGEAFDAAWKNYLKPLFDKLMETADEIWNEHLSPLVENFLDFVGEFINGALEIYSKFIVPLVDFFANLLTPVIEKFVKDTAEFIGTVIDVFNSIITSCKGIIQFVTGVFTGDWEKAWTGVKNIFKGIFDSLVALVKKPVNAIIDCLNGMIAGVVKGINTVIKAINSISLKIPDWVPEIGGKGIGFNLKTVTAPEIPKLANGGFVKKNTPQLALIGDNRHQGEVVAPEGKLLEMAKMAAESGGNPELFAKIIELLETLISLVQGGDDIVLSVDGEELARAVQTGSLRLKRRYTTVEVTM